ncbi:MAG: SLATT domain-containing protein [Proteobacteria bacterium]|nr:SLATT domain-containing protein [Pseudomonadota bacterium]MBU1059447.1 SLATT domain-containing protein [Pseudomonadota bacterium]
MAKKPDISTKKLLPWDEYKGKTPDLALGSIYAHIETTSTTMCAWYWTSIRTKRWTSLWVRAIAFLLLTIGTALPIFAAIQDLAKDKLLFTQWAVALLAIAGLILVADRVFGWSSGWMRYISTVITMENLTRAFELEWAKYIVSKNAALDNSDVKSLFLLAQTLEEELTKLQAEETTKWITEFNSSISLLESMIKSQREETDRKLEAIRTNLSTQATAAEADEKTKLPGAIEVAFTYQAEPKKITITLDSEAPVEFVGYAWSKLNVSPGQHILMVETVTEPREVYQKVVEVQTSTVARPEIKFIT